MSKSIHDMTQHELDMMYADYVANGLHERCPSLPGDERSAWQVKRLYLACRMMTEYLEQNRPPHMLSEAASRVGIATRQPGWAAMEGAWREAMQDVFNQADTFSNENDENPMLLEDEMTHYLVTVVGRWDNEDKEFTGVRDVVFSARLKNEPSSSD
jgi:hypothetical protein